MYRTVKMDLISSNLSSSYLCRVSNVSEHQNHLESLLKTETSVSDSTGPGWVGPENIHFSKDAADATGSRKGYQVFTLWDICEERLMIRVFLRDLT